MRESRAKRAATCSRRDSHTATSRRRTADCEGCRLRLRLRSLPADLLRTDPRRARAREVVPPRVSWRQVRLPSLPSLLLLWWYGTCKAESDEMAEKVPLISSNLVKSEGLETQPCDNFETAFVHRKACFLAVDNVAEVFTSSVERWEFIYNSRK